MTQSILDQYEASLAASRRLAGELRERLEAIVGGSGLKIHSWSCRVKEAESLRRKLARPERTYRELDEITDVLGVRVVTYFEDQVDEVGRLMEQHFAVDLHHSIDKRTSHPAQFGYRSLHYVCRVPEEMQREGAPTYFEIQIRTILQHAWAEIEHDLGYKSPVAIPQGIRRKLSRVAGLLEIADEEFVEIRQFLDRYRRDLERPSPSGGRISIDGDSLAWYVRGTLPSDVDQEIAGHLGKSLSEELFFPDYLIRMLQHVGLRDVEGLDAALGQRRAQIVASVSPYFEFTREMWRFSEGDVGLCPRGYSLLFMSHLMVLETSVLEIARIEAATRFFLHLDEPADEAAARRAAERLVEIFRRHRIAPSPDRP